MTSWIVPVLVLLVACGISYQFIFKGEVQDAIVDFGRWSAPKIKGLLNKVRHLRKLINYPFRQSLHERSAFTPFALGQVWLGQGMSFTIIGWAANKDWVVDFGRDRKVILDPLRLREVVAEQRAYLYDINQEINYTPKSVDLYGTKAVIVERF